MRVNQLFFYTSESGEELDTLADLLLRLGVMEKESEKPVPNYSASCPDQVKEKRYVDQRDGFPFRLERFCKTLHQ